MILFDPANGMGKHQGMARPIGLLGNAGRFLSEELRSQIGAEGGDED
jgi:hypothetical protein